MTTFWFDDSQVACVVTSTVVPSERFAVAANGEVAPILGDVPLTVTNVTEPPGGDGVGVGAVGVEEEEGDWLPHAPVVTTMRTSATVGATPRI